MGGSSNGGSPVAAEYTTVELQGDSAPGFKLPAAGTITVFDSAGNLWIGSPTANSVSEYLSTQP